MVALVLLMVGMSLSTAMVFAQDAPASSPSAPNEGAASPSSSPTPLPGECSQILNAPSNVSLPASEQGDVMVIVGESISPEAPPNFPYSCSQVVNCLRYKHETEAALMDELKSRYAFCLVTGEDGLDLLSNYAALVYQWIAGIVGAICILVIVGSGIQISMGGLSQEEVTSAKDRIFRSLGGLAILFLSAFILYTINPIFFT